MTGLAIRMTGSILRAGCLGLMLAVTALPAAAQEVAPAATPAQPVEKPAPYDQRLLRLSEILGSVHYLRVLCKASDPDDWRQVMQELLDKEARGKRRGRRALPPPLIAATEPLHRFTHPARPRPWRQTSATVPKVQHLRQK